MSKQSRFRQPESLEVASSSGSGNMPDNVKVLDNKLFARSPRATVATNPFLEPTTTNPFCESPLQPKQPNPFDDTLDPSDDLTIAEISAMSSTEDQTNQVYAHQASSFDLQFQRNRKNCPEPSGNIFRNSDSSFRKLEDTSRYDLSGNQSSDDPAGFTEATNKVETDSNRKKSFRSSKESVKYVDAGDENLIYHQNRMSEPWLYTALVVHIIQFGILLTLGRPILSNAAMVVLVLLVAAVAILLLLSRKLVKKNRKRSVSTTLFRKRIEGSEQRTPEDEADDIPSAAIHCLGAAAVLEGCTFALYTVMLAGYDKALDNHSGQRYGGKQRQIILETMRFASITLLTFHRILRPANRVDPMRTMLEVRDRYFLSLLYCR